MILFPIIPKSPANLFSKILKSPAKLSLIRQYHTSKRQTKITNNMKKLLILLLSALSLTAVAQNKSVAILNPIDRDESVSPMYEMVVRSSFESVASITQGYEAFDRTALDAIMSEHNFQRSGAVNDAEVRQIGQMAGVDYVLVTEVSAESDYLMVLAKILNVETAKYDRAVDDLMQMTPPIVKEGCTVLAQKLFRINIQTGNQKGEITYDGDRYVGEYRDGKPKYFF